MKVNLSNHLAWGFHEQWQDMQGLSNKNLLELLITDSIRQGNSVVGITSEESKPIVKGSVDDRFNYLFKNYASDFKEKGWTIKNGEGTNLAVVTNQKRQEQLVVVNTQAVQALEDDQTVKILVVGGNDVTNGLSVSDTLDEASEKGYLMVAENPCGKGYNSIQARAIRAQAEKLDAIVTHDAQYCIHNWVAKVPGLGRLKEYTRDANRLAGAVSNDIKKPGIAMGNQHGPSNCKAGFELDGHNFLEISAPGLVDWLRNELVYGDKQKHKNINSYEFAPKMLRQALIFQKGTENDKHHEYTARKFK
tara:strand:+ start:5372 stop:6286 length:915 start_codon:yes stop_codon:yes gene_type:complete